MQSAPVLGFLHWLERIGAKIVQLPPDDHDRIVALTSHLPQLASTTLAVLLSTLRPEVLDISGSGARDMTRLALSSFDIWRDILATNRDAIEHALSVYIDKLTELRHNLQTQQVCEDFRVAADLAVRLRK
jgi:prephenate dehydrogenase